MAEQQRIIVEEAESDCTDRRHQMNEVHGDETGPIPYVADIECCEKRKIDIAVEYGHHDIDEELNAQTDVYQRTTRIEGQPIYSEEEYSQSNAREDFP